MKRHQGSMNLWLPVFLIACFVLLSQVAMGASGRQDDDEEVEDLWERPRWADQIPMDLLRMWNDIGDRAGFEIGNGRKLIKNVSGQYLLKIYKDWEAGTLDKMTEIISPLNEGIPRARLRINVMPANRKEVINQLLDPQGWVPVALDKLEGIQKETVHPSGIHEVEVRLFRESGEMILLQMDGTPGKANDVTAFDKVQSAMTTFQTLSPSNE